LHFISEHGEGWWEAELHRLQGLLQVRQYGASTEKAEDCFRQALEIARRQEARSLELRAAVSLAHLWSEQNKCREAQNLLTPVYNWFTEGFDTPDLQDAKMLLEKLSNP
jgi:predicted ATPase